jgi:hypothetical protein
MARFHSGRIGMALCGVWQKMHTCSSLLARTAPGPVAERLCGLSMTLCTWAELTDEQSPEHNTPAARTRAVDRSVRVRASRVAARL